LPGYFGQNDQVDIDVFYDNSWHDVYQREFPQLVDNEWFVQDLPQGTQNVSKVRLRSHTKYLGIYCNLVEFDFGQVSGGGGGGGGLPPQLFGDLDGDCDVDIVDIMKVASIWGTRSGEAKFKPEYDFDADGQITVIDVMRVAAKWNTRCGE
jgi:hypothetical protein